MGAPPRSCINTFEVGDKPATVTSGPVTTLPDHVNVPVTTPTPDKGSPVQLVSVPDDGVPKTGVVKTGLVKVLFVKVSVELVVTTPIPSTAILPAETLETVVSVACPSSIDPTPNAADVEGVKPLIGKPVQLVSVPADGVPKLGVTKVGEVESTLLPLPVEVVTPVPPLATGKVPVTPVVKGKPVQLVSVPADGVPKTGVTKVGEVDNTMLPLPVEVVTPVPPRATGKVPAVTCDALIEIASAPPEVCEAAWVAGIPKLEIVSV